MAPVASWRFRRCRKADLCRATRQRAADHVGQLGLAIRLGQQQHAGVEAALMHDRVVGIA